MNKILLISGRGIGARQRYLMKDLEAILPNVKKDNKLDSKNLSLLNEMAYLENCSHCMFFEPHKYDELYLWLSACPNGPSIKFYVHNILTVMELNSIGNFTYGTRPLLSFDPNISQINQGSLIQNVLTSIFNVPAGHRKGHLHEFYERIFHFSVLDGKLWMRHYQILTDGCPQEQNILLDGMFLREIGPRFVLEPVKIFEGSFRGKIIWSNTSFKSLASAHIEEKKKNISKYAKRVRSSSMSALRKNNSYLPSDNLIYCEE